MEPVIETQGLKHVYIDADNNQVTALDGIGMQIQPGEFVAVIGANGSGKSTLARHFNALLLPTEGSVKVHGLDTLDENNLWRIRQDTGMVFQNPDNQIVAAIVEEDVAFGPENIGVPTEELKKRVEDALRAVDMLDYREHAPHLLSGGQKQRVAIAGTLALGSKCIVLKLNREQHITVVYITHFMTEALLADRVIVMSKGKIEFQGTPKEVFSRVDELEKLGLEAPLAAKVAFELRKSGAKLPPGIITNEELAAALA